MSDSTKAKMEREKVLRKLLRTWRTSKETQPKADVLVSRNPELKRSATGGHRKKF
ncbi:MAG TPA: hypothetical protein VN616_03425 [Puia sp.]|nr:hypothetical protein [Puia sp.]